VDRVIERVIERVIVKVIGKHLGAKVKVVSRLRMAQNRGGR
jgi:hypothetical protein